MPRHPSNKDMAPLADQLGPEDGIDPRLIRPDLTGRTIRRNTLQLCRQVGGTLGTAALGALLIALLLPRLSQIPGAPLPEMLVDAARWSQIAPSVLGPSRDALGGALASMSHALIGIALCGILVALAFPDVHARTGPNP